MWSTSTENIQVGIICIYLMYPLKQFFLEYYQKHKNEIVLHFYLTLQKVLKEHENCTDFCELIFYDGKY